MLAVECREPFGKRNGQRIQNKEDPCLAKIPSACVFRAFQLARVGRSRRLLTVKISRHLLNFLAGWSFGEAQIYQRNAGAYLCKGRLTCMGYADKDRRRNYHLAQGPGHHADCPTWNRENLGAGWSLGEDAPAR